MYDINKTLEIINENALSNDYNCIPFTRFPKLENFIPGITKEGYTCLTASTGVGKSTFMRRLFIFDIIDYAILHNVKVNILIYSLEESKRQFILSLISDLLRKKFNMTISKNKLESIGRKNKITARELECVNQVKQDLNAYMQYVDVIEDKRTPLDIYMHSKKMKSNDPNCYNIIIVDHISLLEGITVKAAIDEWGTYGVKLRNTDKFYILDIQQQALSNESIDHVKANKLEPSINGLGDSKTQSRNYDLILGLFNPYKHELSSHRGYRIKDGLGPYYRSLKIIKNRNGIADVRLPLFFDGKSGSFFELPPKDSQLIEDIYTKIADGNIQELIKELESQ